MIKVLCIDDEPESIVEGSKESLEQILRRTYKNKLEIIFEPRGEKGTSIAEKDRYIQLVLLDIEFKRQPKQGNEIIKDLFKVRPDLKIIVLTREENKTPTEKRQLRIYFGKNKNKVHYVVKSQLAAAETQRRLLNLSIAITGDFENKNWHMEYGGSGVIQLMHNNGQSYGVNIPSMSERAVLECMANPNKPVNISSSITDEDLNRVHHKVNENVREKTEWNTWGILTKEGCAKGQLKLAIGHVKPVSRNESSKDPYVTQSQFEKLKREFEIFRKDVLNKLEIINKPDTD